MNTGSGNGTPGLGDGGEDAVLRDPALRRALDHAPDSDALPDPRTRDAIRKMAHNLASVPAAAPAAEDNKSAAPWWRRLFGGGGGSHARMPWNAAFATVLLATFVTVLWHREPVPDARLDGEARVASAPATAPEAAPSAAAVPGPTAAPAPAPAAAPAQPRAEAARDAVSEESMRSRDIAVRRSAPPPPGKPEAAAPAPEPQTRQAAPEPPPLPAPPPAPASPAAAMAPPPPPAAMAPAAPPATREAIGGGVSASSSPALSAPQGSPSAEAASSMLRSAPAPRAAVVAGKAAASPVEGAAAFSALDQWTSLNATRAGQGVRHARGDTEGLAALVNTLARSATAPGAELAAPVEARLELYRGGTLLAVLEITGDQVRWTPQGTAAGASIGTPPAQALAELKALLAR